MSLNLKTSQHHTTCGRMCMADNLLAKGSMETDVCSIRTAPHLGMHKALLARNWATEF